MNNDLDLYSPDQKKMFLEQMYSLENIRRNFIIYRKILIAKNNNQIVGFLVGDKTFGGVGFISWLGVKKQFRRKRIGTALLSNYVDFCRTKGAHLIEIYTFNTPVGFYKKLGFKFIGKRERGYFGVVNIIMDKEI